MTLTGFAIRPEPQVRNAVYGGSAQLTGLPVSAVGLTTRQRREAEGGHDDLNASDPD